MIKVSTVVADILQTDELAQEALRLNLLNLTAYASQIRKKVENATLKPVKKGTIVVSLSRIAKNLKTTPSLMPPVELENLGFTSSLSLLVYAKTPDIQRKISVLNSFSMPPGALFSISEGKSEISIVCAKNVKDTITQKVDTKLLFEEDNLVAVTVNIAKKYASTPNILYVLLSSLATKRIVILEIISTYLEISFIIRKEDMEKAIGALNIYFSQT